MARKSKTETPQQANGKGPEPARASAGAESKAKTSQPTPRKAPSKKKNVRASKPVAPKKGPRSGYEPSDEEIRIRAYFIAERRVQLSLQGDSTHDWIEARRQLVEEASRTAS